MKFRYNPSCSCSRCRAHGYMGPAVLITIGVLFLLDQIGHVYWMDFGFTWPALLIVIGVIMLLSHSASMEGHVPRGQYPPAWQPPNQQVSPGGGYPVPPAPPVAPPPPVPPAGFIASGSSIKGPDDRGGA